MQGYRYPDPMLNKGGSGTGISPTLKDFLLPIYRGDYAGEVEYKKSHFLQKARTLCDLGFFAKHRHLSDDALILEIICLSIDCDRSPETLFLEGNYREMLEVDTERILCCPSLEEWIKTLEDDLDTEDNLYILSDLLFDDEDYEDNELLHEDCKKIREEDTLPDEDCEEKLEEYTLLDKNCKKAPEYSFNTLLDSLGKLSKVSRGKFVPENIIEVDNNCIQFNLEGKNHRIMLNGFPYEPSILAGQINPIILETGYQFKLLSGTPINQRYDGYEVYVILLSEDEKQKLAEDTDGLFDDFWMLPHCYASLEFLYGEEPPDYRFNLFLETLRKLSIISRGKFIPQNIVELGNKSVQFDLNAKTHSLTIDFPPDDPFILAGAINPIISDTGFQFELLEWIALYDMYLFLLSAKEKQDIIDKTGWTFNNFWMNPKF